MIKTKDSGIEWIGEIPEDWEVKKIANHFKLRKVKVSDKDYAPLSVAKVGVVPQMENVAKSDASDDRKLVLKGDFVINSRSDRKQSCGVSKFDGSVSLINIVIEPRKICSEFVGYVLKNYGFAEEFYRWGHGIVADLWTTNWEDMKKISIPVPPIQEQKRIAEILDVKCAKIDKLIKLEETAIEKIKDYKTALITKYVVNGFGKFKLKNSGLDLIGEIPEDWEVKKLKYCCSIVRGGSPRPIEDYISETNEGYNWIKIGDTEKNSKYINKTKDKIIESGLSKTRLVHKNDLILTNSMSFGEPYILNIDGCIHDGWVAFSKYKGISKEYLYYFLSSSCCREQFKTQVAGGVVQNLNIEKVGNTYITIPDIKTQNYIIENLEIKLEKVNKLLYKKMDKIEALQEFRKSLIYEYVTGKKEI